MLFKGNQFYSHALLRINYTTYDLRHENDSINPRTDHCNIMLLAQNDGSGSATSHPFCYARVLGIYHANIILTGPESSDYQSRRLEFLWVRWLELLEIAPAAGFEDCSLDKGRFVPTDLEDAFGFVDPADVLRSCHLVPAFADGQQRVDGIATSRNSRDSDEWKHYYINRCVSMQTYHLLISLIEFCAA